MPVPFIVRGIAVVVVGRGNQPFFVGGGGGGGRRVRAYFLDPPHDRAPVTAVLVDLPTGLVGGGGGSARGAAQTYKESH